MRIDPDKAIVGDVIVWPNGLREPITNTNLRTICVGEWWFRRDWLAERDIVIERPDPEEVEGVVQLSQTVLPNCRVVIIIPSWEPGTPVIVKVKA